jgi:hypothetical protein
MLPCTRSLRLRPKIVFAIALIACASIGYRMRLLSNRSVYLAADSAHSPPPFNLNGDNTFAGDSECVFHFLWALSWGQGVRQSEFSLSLMPPPPHCISFPDSYRADAALQSRSLIKSPSFCFAMLTLIVPLPSLPSPAAAGAYACWYLNYLARHFSLMRRVAEAPAPDASPSAPFPFNVSAVLELMPQAPPNSETKCKQLQLEYRQPQLRCCLQDDACIHLHASQLTWIIVPQLLRMFVLERQLTPGVVGANDVSETLLLETLRRVKSPAAASGEYETHKLWTNFITMTMLLPHKRRLRSVELDHALASVTQGQSPGTEFAIFSEFSRCASPTSIRYGSSIAENLRANVKSAWGSKTEVVYATFDESCTRQGVRSNQTPHHLPFVMYSRITQEGGTLDHCSRDLDSPTRAVWTWEILKRGVSVINVDPDVFFFRPMPLEYVTDSCLALTSYTHPQLVYCDSCEQTRNLQCLGLNTVDAHTHGPAIYSLLYATMLTDVAGVENFDFFGIDGKPNIGYCDERSLNPEFCNEMKHSRWAAWRCDDQFVFYKIRDLMLRAGVVRALRSGPHKETLINSTGYLTWRVLSASEFAMARTWLRGHKTGNEIALHMATFSGDKVNGLREEEMWLVDPPSYFAGDFVELSPAIMRAARSLDEEKHLLLLLLRSASFFNRTVVLPAFNCEFTPVVKRGSWGWPFRTLWDMLYAVYDEWGMEGSFLNSSRWQTVLRQSPCPFYFHFSYRSLEAAGVRFRSSTFFKSFDQFGTYTTSQQISNSSHDKFNRASPSAVLIKSYQDFLSLFKASTSSVPQTNHKHDAESSSLLKTVATRLVLDWDMSKDSVQLWNLMGTFTENEIGSMLTATEVDFNV